MSKPRPRRRDALELCRERGFSVGDVLVSDHWKKPRRIVSLERSSVLYTAGSAMDTMTSMPDDVRRAAPS